jgi:hypothetical protein
VLNICRNRSMPSMIIENQQVDLLLRLTIQDGGTIPISL